MPSYRFRWGEPGVIDLSDNTTIPPDPDGARWRAYLEWMYAGNEALPALEPPPPPKALLSKYQLVSRFTVEEAAAIEAARASVSPWERMLWESAPPMLDTDDPLLRGFLTQVLGAERMEEVLSVEGL